MNSEPASHTPSGPISASHTHCGYSIMKDTSASHSPSEPISTSSHYRNQSSKPHTHTDSSPLNISTSHSHRVSSPMTTSVSLPTVSPVAITATFHARDERLPTFIALPIDSHPAAITSRSHGQGSNSPVTVTATTLTESRISSAIPPITMRFSLLQENDGFCSIIYACFCTRRRPMCHLL